MEKEVAKTLLEESKVIVIGGETLEMKPPSIATLVLASKYIGELPSKKLDEDQLIPEMIQKGYMLLPMGNAMSAMILGAVEFNKLANPVKSFFTRRKVTKGQVLAEKIVNSDIKEVLNSFYTSLEQMKLTDFFQLTTFLIELNVTKRTRRVVK